MQLLLACGNNAVSQLGVSNSRNVDVFYRACDGDRVKVLYTCPVQAVVQILTFDHGEARFHESLHIQGCRGGFAEDVIHLEGGEDYAVSAFGDHNGCVGLITRSGRLRILAAEEHTQDHDNISAGCEQALDRPSMGIQSEPRYLAIVTAGNGATVALLKPSSSSSILKLLQFSSLGTESIDFKNENVPKTPRVGSFLAWHYDTTELSNRPMWEKEFSFDITALPPLLVANAIAFCLLIQTSNASQVYTWGDERYPLTLGRLPSVDAPASIPNVVPQLSGPFKINTVDAGGFMMAAVSELGDGWIWGLGATPGFNGLGKRVDVGWWDCISECEAEVDSFRKIVLPRSADSQTDAQSEEQNHENELSDIAIGRDHVIILDGGGVWTAGSNRSGQLGIASKGGEGMTQSWQPIRLVDRETLVSSRVRSLVASASMSYIVMEQ